MENRSLTATWKLKLQRMVEKSLEMTRLKKPNRPNNESQPAVQPLIKVKDRFLDSASKGHAPNTNGDTLLHFAIKHRHVPLFYQLLKTGAPLNVRNDYGNTPLHIAVALGNREFVQLLLESGANTRVKNLMAFNPLHALAYDGPDNEDIAKLLINYGVAFDEGDDDGFTPLHYALGKNKRNLIKLLLRRGADINKKPGYFPLDNVVLFCKSGILEILFSEGVKTTGSLALHYACRYDSTKKIKILLKHGADINFKHKYFGTPLDMIQSESMRTKYIIGQHVAILKFQHLFVLEENLTKIKKCSYWWKMCEEFRNELERMSITKINNVYFCDLLLINPNRLILLIKNPELLSAFRLKLSSKQIPLYAKDLYAVLSELEEMFRKML